MYAIINIMIRWYVLQCWYVLERWYVPDHEHDTCDTLVQLLVVYCALQHPCKYCLACFTRIDWSCVSVRMGACV